MPDVCEGAGCDDELGQQVIWRGPTTHQESRQNTSVDTIVVHYTTSRNIEGTISWFKNAPPGKRASAHYIVSREGAIVHLVPLDQAAWHAGSRAANLRSIGIEHVAAPGDRLSQPQSAASKLLIKWLMNKFEVDLEKVVPHRALRNTNCFGDILLDYGAGIDSSADDQKKALDNWLNE